MAASAIIVNGIPGSGKTTLATALAAKLGLPLVAKDAIKESIADLISAPLPSGQVGALASDVMWSIVGMLDGPVIVDSFWATGRDERYFESGVAAAGIVLGRHGHADLVLSNSGLPYGAAR